MVESVSRERSTNPFISNYIEEEKYAYLKAVEGHTKIPSAAWRYYPRSDEDFYFTSSKIVLRKIFYGGWPLCETEVNEIKKFKDFVAEKGLPLPEGMADEEILRQLMAGKYNLQTAYDRLINVINWRKEAFPLKINEGGLAVLQSGYIYFHGRDRSFKPFMVIRPAVLFTIAPEPTTEDIEQAVFVVLEYLRNNLLIPGQVESMFLIVDLNELGLLNLPYGRMKSIMASINAYYRGMASKIFVLNGSFAFKVVWSTVSAFLDETTLQKIMLTDQNTCDELKALAHPSQLEAKFGGEAPNYGAPFWPPRMPEFIVDEQVEAKLVPEVEYEKFLEEHPKLMKRPEN